MEAILPSKIISESKHFLKSAVEIGFDEFVALKFIYVTQDSDLDVLQLMADERLHLLLYGWEIVHKHMQTLEKDFITIPGNVLTVIKQLTHYSFDLWFAKEWQGCQNIHKIALIYCLKRARPYIDKIVEFSAIDWDYLFILDLKPWRLTYLDKFLEAPPRDPEAIKQVVETVEDEASIDDVRFLLQERFLLIVLRLIKMFDAGALLGVKNLAMRVIISWNHEFERLKEIEEPMKILEDDKRCLVLICHIYLMTIYEMDDERGLAIDNMVHSIRFYCQSLKEQSTKDDYVIDKHAYTAALYIATTCMNLSISGREFFEFFIFDSFDEHFTTLFGAISQAYLSYILGNMLMELNNQNEEDFQKNLEYFKRLINSYVPERERSELFMLSEMRKQDQQRNSHNECDTVKNMTNFKSKICKGNRMSNIGAYEDRDKIESVFQNLPNNKTVLSYVYDLLAKRNYKGWHYAKLVLLLKIIGHELNSIETWRYHPGLSTDFMLSLETELSHHFVDLANIFQDHHFMEQEFWLTAFYLNPCSKLYESVLRCGSRFHRRRQLEELNGENPHSERVDRAERSEKVDINSIRAKFGLLSSTIDVKEIVELTNQETPTTDYEQLDKALHKFRLPESMIKDLLTVTFLPRNKAFAWAVNWPELRKRCKFLMKCAAHKRSLVELNMAEANDRLKFLEINYEKYRHRPQLDYGSIERGYENITNYGSNDDSDSDDDDYDFENDSKAKFDEDKRRRGRGKTDNLFNLKEFHFSTRSKTRSRTAAAIASAKHKTADSDENQEKSADDCNESEGEGKVASPPTVVAAAPPLPPTPIKKDDEKITKVDLRVWLQERTTYNNSTNGFKPFPDIWNIDAKLSQTGKTIQLFETITLLQKFRKLKYDNITENKDEKNEEVSGDDSETVGEETEETTSAPETEEYLTIGQYFENEKTQDSNSFSRNSFQLKTIKDNNSPLLFENNKDDDDSLLSETSTSAVKDSGEINDYSRYYEDGDENEGEDNENKEKKEEGEVDSMGRINKCPRLQGNKEIKKKTEVEEKNEDEDKSIEEGKENTRKELQEKNKKTVKSEMAAKEIETESQILNEAKIINQTTNEEKNKTEAEKMTTAHNEKLTKAAPQMEKTEKESESQSIEPANDIKEMLPCNKSPPITTQQQLAEEIPSNTSKASVSSRSCTPASREYSTNDEICELKKSCFERICKIELKKLSIEDVMILRQPRVRIKRMSEEKIVESSRKRRCAKLKSYADSYDSSSNSTYSIRPRRTGNRRMRKRSQSTSGSSLSSDEAKAKKRRANSKSSKDPSSIMVVTPRSASGMKLRIAAKQQSSKTTSNTNSEQNTPEPVFIQISSSSEDEDEHEAAPNDVSKPQLELESEPELELEPEVVVIEPEIDDNTPCEALDLVEEANMDEVAGLILSPIVANVEVDETADPLYVDQIECNNVTYSISFL